MKRVPDEAERKRAISERTRTVLVDAGAGAGKTSTLVARIVELVAPANEAYAPLLLSRIAAVTFTRRAAGELRLRIRGALLGALATPELTSARKQHLLAALADLDAAAIGTIHSFADRLLRLQPMKARLSPAYRIEEDAEVLVSETFDLLLRASQNGTLVSELAGTRSAETAEEVMQTYQRVLRAGMLVHSIERDPIPPQVGLDYLSSAFIAYRDLELANEPSARFDRRAFKAAARSYIAAAAEVDDDSEGAHWLLRLARRVEELEDVADPLACFELVAWIARGKKRFKKTKHFVKGSAGQELFGQLVAEDGHGEALIAPLRSFAAGSLARTRHAVADLYEQVKIRHQAIDTIDLLLTLRNLLRDDLEARGFYQGLFDHILVDELQDTDPLQTEVLLYLAEATPKARSWHEVELAPGRLTLVGDPKQSIYRFRRADIAMYEHLRAQIARGAHLQTTLSANFRSTPALVEWINDRFAHVLGTSSERHIDAETGQAFYQPQVAGREATAGPSVHALPYGFADGQKVNVGPARELEGEAIAHYLRWLVEQSGTRVVDPDTGDERPVAWRDVAVLALVTSNLACLTDRLDHHGVPYALSGGTLFTTDPIHQQFVLGLRALADRHDGVAEAALLRPPFFGIDLLDLVRDRAGAGDAAAARGAAARTWVRETRRLRFSRTPGETARSLLEDTGFGRAVALGPNGSQRLRHLRELCLHLESYAAENGLDYDGATAYVREWIDHPPKLDPPRPVGAAAIQVLTVHQAKGLEFPVVVLWDGVGQWRPYHAPAPWVVERTGRSWALKTNDVAWQEPDDSGMLDREKQFNAAERKRLVYVAATRARDLLVVPRPTWAQGGEYIHATLLDGARPELVHQMEPYIHDQGASWSRANVVRTDEVATVDDTAIETAWTAALTSARSPHHTPRSVTSVAKAVPVLRDEESSEVDPAPKVVRVGRFGATFGDVVHQAIGLVVTRGLSADVAVARAARAVGLTEHLVEAAADVERTVTTLRASGLVGDDRVVRLEYAVAAHRDGVLVSGYLDLASAARAGLDLAVIDFKSDQWPTGATDAHATFPAYVEQVRAYARIVGATRAGLLFTATGAVSWV